MHFERPAELFFNLIKKNAIKPFSLGNIVSISTNLKDIDCLCVAGWSSPVARQAHNLKVAGSNPAPATNVLCVRSTLFFIGSCEAFVGNKPMSVIVLILLKSLLFFTLFGYSRPIYFGFLNSSCNYHVLNIRVLELGHLFWVRIFSQNLSLQNADY